MEEIILGFVQMYMIVVFITLIVTIACFLTEITQSKFNKRTEVLMNRLLWITVCLSVVFLVVLISFDKHIPEYIFIDELF